MCSVVVAARRVMVPPAEVARMERVQPAEVDRKVMVQLVVAGRKVKVFAAVAGRRVMLEQTGWHCLTGQMGSEYRKELAMVQLVEC